MSIGLYSSRVVICELVNCYQYLLCFFSELTELVELSFSHNFIGNEGRQLLLLALAGSKLALLDLSSSSSASSTNIVDHISDGNGLAEV